MVSPIAALEFEDFYPGILKPKASYLAIAEHHSKASLKQLQQLRP